MSASGAASGADRRYRGRFAPSPTGLLHAGSLAAGMASWLDARAHDGVWIVRIEDIDPPREVEGASEAILHALDVFGMVSDEPVIWQHDRHEAYEAALVGLAAKNLVYGCSCSRKEARAAALALGLPENVYPGTCRGTPWNEGRAVRFFVGPGTVSFTDRWTGPYSQDVEHEVGDFVVRRADGLWAYQLAVVVDDLFSGVNHVVRGGDMLENTPRQIRLIEALGGEAPRYMHVPLVLNDRGEKLSKQQGARPLDLSDPLGELERAFVHLGFPALGADSIDAFWKAAVPLWRERFPGL